MVAASEPSLPLLLCGRRGEPKTQVSAGINSVAKNIPLNTRRKAALLAPLEMLMTTLIADAPGVMGVDGLKLHCAPGRQALGTREGHGCIERGTHRLNGQVVSSRSLSHANGLA